MAFLSKDAAAVHESLLSSFIAMPTVCISSCTFVSHIFAALLVSLDSDVT